ncbi:MAG: prenyltransferase/squalene oxidase repeat-containing protein [Pseudomonadota bacterium]
MNTTNTLHISLQKTAAFIAEVQDSSGAIPWFEDGIIDPWDHVEAIMGLTIGGKPQAAQKGFDWLQQNQAPDGFWHAAYKVDQIADDQRAETNFVAYPATGLWHYYLITKDTQTLTKYWPMIERAMAWVLNLQSPKGEIYWAVDKDKGVSRDALITGCSSIFKSLECTAKIAHTLGHEPTQYLLARRRLGDAILNRPELFDRTWPSKDRYSMDWFYPVLTGVLQGAVAQKRINQRWDDFVIENLGCKCVEEEPWVTMAESCELVMALVATGDLKRASQLYHWLSRHQLEDGSWWTGYVYTDKVHWPDERPTWTAGAILMAADAIHNLTPAHHLFNRHLPVETTHL